METPTTAPSAHGASGATTPVRPTVVDETEAVPGTFDYPDDVATTVPVSSAGGRVRVTVAAAGASDLRLTIACPGSSTSALGGDGLTASVTSAAGTCRITLEDGDTATGIAHRFVLHVHYPVTDAGGNNR